MQGLYKTMQVSFAIFFSISFRLLAQKESSVWYFGKNAGVKFNANGTVTALTDGALNTSEGCASIADTNGNLLFYTDGVRIWDKNHLVMPNGTGLLGDISSTQSALITPVIGHPKKYYVFTVDGSSASSTAGPLGSWDGLHYSIVDMDLQGNGTISSPHGDVGVTKNISLVDSTAEKLTAAIHANGVDYWIIVKKEHTNAYYAFLVTCSGVNAIPVISEFNYSTILPGITGGTGCMKASLDGKSIVNAQFFDRVLLFDFNNENGQLSNLRVISSGPYYNFYGASFSPNDSLIYVTEPRYIAPANGGRIFRYQRYATNVAATQTMYQFTAGYPHTLQMGPDGKIYCRGSISALAVLNTPNSLTSPGITESAVSTMGRQVDLGLTNFFEAQYVKPIKRIKEEVIICEKDSVLIGSESFDDFSYRWIPTQGLSNATIANPFAYPTQTTHYQRIIITPCNDTIKGDSVTVDVLPLPTYHISNDTAVCAGKSVAINVNNDENHTYFWLPNHETTPEIEVSVAGNYIVKITNVNQCNVSDTVQVKYETENCNEESVYIPNAFTPNGDGIDDAFYPVFTDQPDQINLSIYNRWGELIFETKTNGDVWSGKNVPIGVYLYNIDFSIKGIKKRNIGTVAVVK